MITKRQIGTIFRRLGKKYDFDYYSGFTCCNSCFVGDLPDGRGYVYMKHGLKGMNYRSSKQFNEQNDWYLAYGFENSRTRNIVFKEFKKEAEKIGTTKVVIPKNEDECLVILRDGGDKNAKV